MSGAVLRRLLREQRLRLPLVVLLIGGWGFALVGLFSTADDATRTAGLAGNAATAFRIEGLDPLAAWAGLGQEHPIFLVGSFLFAVGLGVRAVAGELEAGTLALTLARPITRRRYLSSHVVLLIGGSVVIAVAYAAGAVAADRVFDPPGGPLQPQRMLLAAAESSLLLIAVGTLALIVSALASERGRALGVTLGIAITMYAGNFLFALWSPLRPLARATLFWYFTPGPAIQRGTIGWGDDAVLLAFSVAGLGFTAWWFGRRDLAG